jgi:hypothetical protein
MPTEAQETGLDWNGHGVMGNDSDHHSTVDGRVVIVKYDWENGRPRWVVWVNAGEDAAKFTPRRADEIGADYLNDPECGQACGSTYEEGWHYDIHYIDFFYSFADACKAGAEGRENYKEEWGEEEAS